jgi:hypothetical protein
MTTEPMKRYEPDPYCDSAGWKVIRMQEDKDGQYLDRDDMPVESLHVAVLLMQEHADTFENPATKKHYENLRAALERLLGACE